MANELTNLIASAAAGRSAASPVSNATQSDPTSTSARQTVAASGKDLPENTLVQSNAQLQQAVSDINTYVQSVSRELQFSLHEELPLGRAVITVLDAETQEIIREIPSEQVLAIAKRINEQLAEANKSELEGLIFSAQA